MRKNWMVSLLIVIVSLSFFMLANVNHLHAAKKTTIKLQTVYPALSQTATNLKFFAERVDLLTNGEVEIKIFWPGQMVGAKEGLSAVQRGMIDAFFAGMGLYFSGIIPEAAGVWLPYGWGNTNELFDIMFNYGYLDLLKQAFDQHEVHYVAPMCVGTQGLITKFPVRKLEDVKGKKIRAAGMAGYTVNAFGAAPVNLPPAEIYTALQRGTVDGTTYPWYTIEDYKFYEVASYISTPGFFTPGVCDLIMNRKVWEKLTPEQQKAIDTAGIEMFHNSKKLNDESDEKALEFCKAHNVENIILSDDEFQRFRKAVEPVYEEHGKKSELCAKQLDIINKYREQAALKK
ncbi:TRAP transporter substrate-binding protein [Desulfatitalea tepidiphila]|uniref:TRAP transporter substrate-binding protein n=1 Tax=Desulfatitalea tepidiphila TaxID=1185843 RepID=UPI0006B4D808|nr:TRAP transporter substrate-binding protein DctP [Desulfatitalea tepidiphila]